MSLLLSGVTELVRAMAPDHSSRWGDSLIQSCIFLADAAIREEAEVEWAEYEFDLLDGVIYYPLPADMIHVRTVELSRNSGALYDEWLSPITLMDIDDISYTWETDTGTEPEMYFLQSVPGTPNYSKIAIWRPVVTVASQKIRVNYTKSVESVSDLSTVTMPDEIQQRVYLPFVLGLLMVAVEPAESMQFFAEFRKEIGWARARFAHNKAEQTYRPKGTKGIRGPR